MHFTNRLASLQTDKNLQTDYDIYIVSGLQPNGQCEFRLQGQCGFRLQCLVLPANWAVWIWTVGAVWIQTAVFACQPNGAVWIRTVGAVWIQTAVFACQPNGAVWIRTG